MTQLNFDPNSEKVKEAYGNVIETILPSGKKVYIREQNGNDDDILSNPILAKDGSNINHFISEIVVSSDITNTGKLTPGDVLKMKVRDKYHILFMSRIHSNGKEVKFEYDWGKDNGGKQTYVEDLSNYIWDYSNKFPDELYADTSDIRIKPYLDRENEYREFELVSGKRVRYKYMDGAGEKYLLGLPQNQLTRNAEIKARGLELFRNDKWEKVENFKPFSTSDMRQIRTDIKLMDPVFQGLTDLENPKDGEIISIPIIASPDFFYPEEI